MKFWSDSFKDHGLIPGEFAFGVPDPGSHVALSSNRNPHFGWSDLPHGTLAYSTIFATGLVLFIITLAFNVLGFILRRKFREAY